MPRTGAVSTGTPTAPSAERVGRVAHISGRRIVGVGLTGSKLRPSSSNGGPNESFMVRRHSSGLRRRRKCLARDGPRAKTLGWEHLARHQPVRRPQFVDCRGVRVRPTLGFARLRIAGKWRPAHCASDTQVSAETGPKSSYGYTKSAGFAGFSGPPPSGGQR
jgi:hypothetical protein